MHQVVEQSDAIIMEQNDHVKGVENDPSGLAEADWRAGLALRIKAARQKSGLTLDNFAALAGVSKRTQTAYESAARVPDAEYLCRLSWNLSIDLDVLLTGYRPVQARRITTEDEMLIQRFRALPRKLRDVVETVLLLATLAHSDRKDYPE